MVSFNMVVAKNLFDRDMHHHHRENPRFVVYACQLFTLVKGALENTDVAWGRRLKTPNLFFDIVICHRLFQSLHMGSARIVMISNGGCRRRRDVASLRGLLAIKAPRDVTLARGLPTSAEARAKNAGWRPSSVLPPASHSRARFIASDS